MKIKINYLFWGIAPCLLIFGAFAIRQGAFDKETPSVGNDSLPTRRQLRRSFFEKREVLVVYGARDTQLAEKYQSLSHEISRLPRGDSRRNVVIKFKEASQVSDAEVRENILYLVGSPEGNPILEYLTANFPIKLGKTHIRIGAKEYTSKNAVLNISLYPNPANDSLPVSLLTGNDEMEVYALFRDKVEENGRNFFRQSMDYELYYHKTRSVMGEFGEDWEPHPTTLFDFSEQNDHKFSSKHFNFVDHQNAMTADRIMPLATSVEETTNNILNFIGNHPEVAKINYHIYKNAEEKGLMTGNTAQAHFDVTENAVHTVINEKYSGNFIEKENALLLFRLLGPSKAKALERGLPLYFTDQWQREGYRYWSARLYTSGNALSLKELLDNTTLAMESPLIADCLSGSLVRFLLHTWGKETFLNRYSDWIPGQNELDALEPSWRVFLANEASQIKINAKQKKSGLPYLKGFNFAHEGYSIYNGYASGKATESLEKQKTLGSNATAIVPYSYIRNKNEPAPFPFSDHAGAENDEAVVHSAFEAKKLGMYTLLKPQVFAGGSWPGEIEMLSEKDWERFFGYYFRWIRHYAMLAEIHRMDALCIGVEFTKATLSHEPEWRTIIHKLRGLYQGSLTYAANWGTEFENIGFWDELDFIGLNCYYPLSKNDEPSNEELKANFETVKTKIKTVYQKFQKPIVFTEIGFRSINMPWKNPHAEGDDSINEEHQKRCYQVIYEGI
ncbi:MAG TPA: hypothetical protein VKN36_12305, partial [Eudoraea sp.]|nr:hypothetical protein [Eudoraea sp.]